MKVLLTSLILILLIAYLMCCVNGINGLGNLNNAFVENFNANDKENCDSKIDSLNVIVAPNVPVDENQKFRTGFNADKFDKLSPKLAANHGKFCFPIVRFKYDGIWTDVDHNSKVSQKQDWVLPKKNTKFVDSQYCTDKFLYLPDKKINPGDVISIPTNNCSISKSNPIHCRRPSCFNTADIYKL